MRGGARGGRRGSSPSCRDSWLRHYQLARGRFLFPETEKGKKKTLCFDELQHMVSFRVASCVVVGVRICVLVRAPRRHPIRPPGHVFTGRSSSGDRARRLHDRGDDGNERRQGQACIHVRAEFTTIPSYRGGTRAAPVRLAMACYRPAALLARRGRGRGHGAHVCSQLRRRGGSVAAPTPDLRSGRPVDWRRAG